MTTELISWLYVADLDRSRTFYREGLGLQQVLDQEDCSILRVTDSAFVGLCQRAPPRETPGLLLCFVESDVDGRVRELIAAGASLEQGPRDNPRYRIYHAFLRDPDGHRIEIQRFYDSGWKGDV